MSEGEAQAEATKGRIDAPGATRGRKSRLSPFWLRLLVYVALVAAAYQSIRVIDQHVMRHATVQGQ